MNNPCKEIRTDKLCTMGVGGTRLHITGTKAEIEMVSDALAEWYAKIPRRSAFLKETPCVTGK